MKGIFFSPSQLSPLLSPPLFFFLPLSLTSSPLGATILLLIRKHLDLPADAKLNAPAQKPEKKGKREAVKKEEEGEEKEEEDEVKELLKETTAQIGAVKQNFRNIGVKLEYDDADMEGEGVCLLSLSAIFFVLFLSSFSLSSFLLFSSLPCIFD